MHFIVFSMRQNCYWNIKLNSQESKKKKKKWFFGGALLRLLLSGVFLKQTYRSKDYIFSKVQVNLTHTSPVISGYIKFDRLLYCQNSGEKFPQTAISFFIYCLQIVSYFNLYVIFLLNIHREDYWMSGSENKKEKVAYNIVLKQIPKIKQS